MLTMVRSQNRRAHRNRRRGTVRDPKNRMDFRVTVNVVDHDRDLQMKRLCQMVT